VWGDAYVNSNRDRRSPLLEHSFVPLHEACEAAMHGVPQGDTFFVRLLHVEVDGWLENDFINVAASVT